MIETYSSVPPIPLPDTVKVNATIPINANPINSLPIKSVDVFPLDGKLTIEID